MGETWKPLPSDADFEVSDQGRVRCLRSAPGPYTPRQHRTQSGHLAVSIGRGHRARKVRLVHQLVLEAFVGPCPDGMECCHNNGDPADNRLSNLRWDTRSANVRDAVRHGTYNNGYSTLTTAAQRALTIRVRGEGNGNAKLTSDQVRQIRVNKSWMTPSSLAAAFGVSLPTVCNIQSGRIWRHL